MVNTICKWLENAVCRICGLGDSILDRIFKRSPTTRDAFLDGTGKKEPSKEGTLRNSRSESVLFQG
ncbi:MAG: hypothetical protein LLG06_15895 [Desulfobacteraceae bacterium]|nr:hypothetical protein [Desulfobacteraceae bacterium]